MSNLELLHELYCHRDWIAAEKQSAIDEVMKPVAAAIAEIEDKYADTIASIAVEIADAEAKVKADALHVGATIKGAHLMAVWSKGRVTWDSAKLDGMMVLIPQLEAARKVGEPSVSIRKV